MHLALIAFWYLFMCGWGMVFPYYSLYLGRELGLSGSQVGMVMAMFPLAGIVAQPLWGQIADRTGSRRRLLAILAVGVAVAGLGLTAMTGFATAVAGTALLAVFSTSILPMAMAVSLAAVGRQRIDRFGFVRMWGTLGFLTVVLAFPPFLDWLQAATAPAARLPWHGLGWMFPCAAVFIAASAVAAMAVPESTSLSLRAGRGDVRRLFRHPPFLRLLAVVFVAHLAMQGSINFFPLYVRERGGEVADVGRMWIFMLLLEIPLVALSGTTLRRLGARGLLTAGLLAEGVRWTACAFVHDLEVIAAVQLLHGVGVAGVLLGAPLYLEQATPEGLRSTGQALVATAGFGLAAIVSNTAFGWLLEHRGVDVPYGAAGALVVALAVLLPRVLPEPRPPDPLATDSP